jgi:hypothetical protein
MAIPPGDARMSVNTDLMKTHSASGWRRLVVIVVSGLLLSASVLSAQEQGASASGVRTDTVSLWRFSRSIILDPTTYAPALTLYEAARLDWASSQVFFRNGFVELNGRFTVSGRPGDAPVSYRVGHRRIVGDAFTIMQGSVAHNVTAQVIERLLIARYPRHRKLVRVMGWVERVSFASIRSYHLSAGHFRQWQANEQRAAELGLK